MVEPGQVVGEGLMDEGRAIEVEHYGIEKRKCCERQRQKGQPLVVEEGE